MTSKSLLWFVALGIGYLLLLVADFYFLPSPWSYIVAAFIVIKAAVFMWALQQAKSLGTRRRPSNRI